MQAKISPNSRLLSQEPPSKKFERKRLNMIFFRFLVLNYQNFNMKLVLASILVVSARAFVPHAVSFGARQSITYTLQATSNEDAIQEALRISKENGATSQEARVAWDIVEELNASDNS